MKVAAIVSEFNPFHNGHKLLVDYCKQDLKADYVITIMSGDFVQRGVPSFMDKETRTKMALLSGVDAVFLLPTVYSTMSAELFAYSSVYLLTRLNIVDFLVFGSESGDINEIKACAEEINSRGDINSEQMQALLKEGNTFAKARAILFPEYTELLSSPNNTLGIEYCLSLNKLGSSITPITVKREDDGYNSEVSKNETFASANAIRSLLSAGNESEAAAFYPPALNNLYSTACQVEPNDFSEALYYALLLGLDNLTDYTDVSYDFAAKIKKNLKLYSDFTQFSDLLKSKDLTHSGITRALIHILLNIKGTPSYYKEKLTEISHIRLLGIHEGASDLFSKLKSNSTIEIATKVPDVEDRFNAFTDYIFKKDLFSFSLYDKTVCNKYSLSQTLPEYSKLFIKIK